MFTLDEILKLHDAGFTADQITALSGIGIKTVNTETPIEKTIEAASEPKQIETIAASEPKQENPQIEVNTLVDGFKKAVDEALKDLRSSAINNSQQPQTETVNDILASVINPK